MSTNLTLSIPDELKKKMNEFKIMNWSEVAREAFEKKITQLRILESFSKDNELTDEEALKLGKKLKEGMWKKYKEKGW